MRYHLKITDNDRLLLDIDLEESSPTQTPRPEAPVATVDQRAPAEPTLEPDVREHRPVTPSAITISGTGKKERLTVEWRQPGVTNTFRANCWADQKAIWPRVMERVKQPTVFLVKESKGYLNIVGVKS